jgi:hypothetical protein
MLVMALQRRAAALIVALGLILCGSTSSAAAEEATRRSLPKGETFWGMSGAVGTADGSLAGPWGSIALDISRTLTDTVGPGWMRGRMGVKIELVPLFLLSQESTAYAAGFNLLGRHYLDGGGKLRPFITLGAGMLVSAEEIPDGVENVNFTPQAGLGLLFFDQGPRVYSIELRFHHLSNGKTTEPNPGLNSAVVQFAVLFAGR